MARLLSAALALFCLSAAPARGDTNYRELFIPGDSKPAGISAAERFFWGRVKFNSDKKVPDQWDAWPVFDVFFLSILKKRTNIEVDETWYVADLKDPDELVKYPILFMTADGNFECSENELANLKEYLLRGGFLFADDCVFGSAGDKFFTGFKQKIEALFGRQMVRLPNDHSI